ncbi:MAG: complex I NDUFA9 subunit family protein [Caulobacterales bacterium]
MQGLVTVFGGSGFVGTQVVRALAKRGYRIRVAVRRPWRAYRSALMGDVGQIEVVQANVRAPETVARALEGAEACVNAVGLLYETGRQKFQDVHAQGARTIAEAAKAAGAARFVQISAIGADAHSTARYARTKAAGEAAVREVFADSVILRPSIVFGPDDHFFNRFAGMAVFSPALPLIGGGHTRFQPVFVGDVGKAVAAAVASPDAAGQTYELGGPGVYSFRDLMELTLKEIGRSRMLLAIPFGAAKLIGAAGDLVALSPFPIAPLLTDDQVELLRADNIVHEGALDLADLGVQPTALEPILPTYLYRFRKGGQYADLGAPVVEHVA